MGKYHSSQKSRQNQGLISTEKHPLKSIIQSVAVFCHAHADMAFSSSSLACLKDLLLQWVWWMVLSMQSWLPSAVVAKVLPWMDYWGNAVLASLSSFMAILVFPITKWGKRPAHGYNFCKMSQTENLSASSPRRREMFLIRLKLFHVITIPNPHNSIVCKGYTKSLS